MLEAGIPTTFIHVFVHLTGKYPEELIAITVEEAASLGYCLCFMVIKKKHYYKLQMMAEVFYRVLGYLTINS